jgi:hypothetical protein
MLRAYRRASDRHGEVKRWQQLASFSPTETRRYVSRIEDLMQAED